MKSEQEKRRRTQSRQIIDQNDITPASPESPIWTGPHLCSSLQSLLPKIFHPEWHKPDIRSGVGIGTNGQKVTAHLIEIEHQVQLADIIKKGVCFLYKPPGQPSILIGRPNAPRISTNRCMASRYASSLSFASTQTQKKRPA
jgi:hypothetical protein